MLVASPGLTPPTLLAALTGGLAAGCLLSVTPRGFVLFRNKLVRLECLGFNRRAVCTGVGVTLAAGTAALAYLAANKGQPLVAAALAVLMGYGMGWLLTVMIERRERRLRNQLADLGVVMSGAVRANVAPALALEHALAESSRPLTSLLSRVVEDYHRGIPLRAGLAAVGARLDLDAVTLFATAIGVTLERGGRLDEALDRISASLRDQQRLENKLDALTAGGRNALVMLAIFPFGFAAFFYALDPGGYDVILESTLGQLGIGACLSLVFLSVRWGKSILDGVGA